jgi:hypothetical protein
MLALSLPVWPRTSFSCSSLQRDGRDSVSLSTSLVFADCDQIPAAATRAHLEVHAAIVDGCHRRRRRRRRHPRPETSITHRGAAAVGPAR